MILFWKSKIRLRPSRSFSFSSKMLTWDFLCALEMQEKLKAMLTQVHRGESAPRVTGNYPQGLKPSSQNNGMSNHGRNNHRYMTSSVNNPSQRNGVSNQFLKPWHCPKSHSLRFLQFRMSFGQDIVLKVGNYSKIFLLLGQANVFYMSLRYQTNNR